MKKYMKMYRRKNKRRYIPLEVAEDGSKHERSIWGKIHYISNYGKVLSDYLVRGTIFDRLIPIDEGMKKERNMNKGEEYE